MDDAGHEDNVGSRRARMPRVTDGIHSELDSLLKDFCKYLNHDVIMDSLPPTRGNMGKTLTLAGRLR